MTLKQNEAVIQMNLRLAEIMAYDAASRDDIDVFLLELFLEEADELCAKISDCLRVLRENANDDVHLINRLLHTLKGSARMTGAMRIGHLAHRMEGHLLAAKGPDMQAVLAFDFEQINSLLDELRRFDLTQVNNATGLDRNEIPPFAVLSERLYRTVRQTAREVNKRVNLELSGTVVEGRMLDKMVAPLEHLLRNAIVHGLEDEPQRIAGGKDVIGEIRLSLRQEADQLIFEVSDDGLGLNLSALRAQAISKGLIKPDDTLDDDQLAQLIFVPGISTASKVTELSGRGIGMDVVHSEVAAMGGQIDVSSKAGRSTQFIIRIPVT